MRTEVHARQALQQRDVLASVGRRLAAGLARCEAVRRTLHGTGHTLAVGQQRFILRACGSRGAGRSGLGLVISDKAAAAGEGFAKLT